MYVCMYIGADQNRSVHHSQHRAAQGVADCSQGKLISNDSGCGLLVLVMVAVINK